MLWWQHLVLIKKAYGSRGHHPETVGIFIMYFYIITNSNFKGWVKIGKAENLNKRLYAYQTYCPNRDFKIEFFIETKYAFLIEGYFRKHIGNTNAEWYKCSVEYAIGQIKTAIEIIESKRV